jgi:DNA-binding MarR family transcriptional regulator
LTKDITRTYNSFRLFLLGKKIRDTFRLEVEKNDVSIGHAMIINVLNGYGSLSQVQMSRILNITPASVSNLIQSMLKDQLIERKADEKDERIMLATLSEKGLAQSKIVKEAWKSVEQRFTGAFTNEENQLISQLLNKFEEKEYLLNES